MKKPSCPTKPNDPVYPDTHIRNQKISIMGIYDDVSVQSIIQRCEEVIIKNPVYETTILDLNKLIIEEETGYYGERNIDVHYLVDYSKDKTYFKIQVNEYNKRKITYDKKIIEYDKKYKEYKKQLKEYNEKKKFEEVDYKRKLYEQLKSEFENV